KGQNDQAIADFDETLRLKPDDKAALQSRKAIYQARGETPPQDPVQGDDNRYDPAQPFQPTANTPEAEEKRKSARRELLLADMTPAERSDPERVIAQASEAINARPDATAAYAKRAQGHVASGNLDAAIEDYGAVGRLDPRNAQLYLRLALAHELQGQLYHAL